MIPKVRISCDSEALAGQVPFNAPGSPMADEGDKPDIKYSSDDLPCRALKVGAGMSATQNRKLPRSTCV